MIMVMKVTNIKYLIYVRSYSKYFTHINSFKPYSSPLRKYYYYLMDEETEAQRG